MSYVKEHGIQTSIHYPPVHQFSYYQHVNCHASNLAITEDVASREVTLPLYPTMKESDVKSVVNHIKNFVHKN